MHHVPAGGGHEANTLLARIQAEVGYDKLLYDDKIGKVSLIGAGMRSHPGVAASFFACIGEAGVNIEMISTSEIRISVVVDEEEVDAAVAATHTAFDLDADDGLGRGTLTRNESRLPVCKKAVECLLPIANVTCLDQRIGNMRTANRRTVADLGHHLRWRAILLLDQRRERHGRQGRRWESGRRHRRSGGGAWRRS